MSPRLARLLVVGFILHLGLFGIAVPQETVTSEIVDGELTSESPETVAELFQGQFGCTGTLIGCNTVLSAAHCFCGEDDTGATCTPNPAGVEVFLQHAGSFPVESIAVHPNYEFQVRSDIAVLRLGRSVTGVTPVAINEQVKPPFGTEGLIIGFGNTRADVDDAGIKRRGQIETASCLDVPNDTHVCWSFNQGDGSSNICTGDSGGPLSSTSATAMSSRA